MSCRPFAAPRSLSLLALAALGPLIPARAPCQPRCAIVPQAHPALCAEVADAAPDASPENGAPVQLGPCARDGRQAWQFVDHAVFVSSAACLAVDGGVDRDGTDVRVRPCDPRDGAQRFVREGELLRWVGHDRCVDVARGRMAAGTRLEIWRCSAHNDNQRFALRATEAASADGREADAPGDAEPVAEPVVAPDAAPDAARGEVAKDVPDGGPAPEADGPRAAPAARGAVRAPADAGPPAVPFRQSRHPADRLQSAGTYLGMRHTSLASFLKRYPALKPLRRDLIDAARSVRPPLPPTLLAALAIEASGGNPAVAGGLMQLGQAASCAAQVPADLHDARANLFAAARCLHHLLNEADDDLPAALSAYGGEADPHFVDALRARLLAGAPAYDPL